MFKIYAGELAQKQRCLLSKPDGLGLVIRTHGKLKGQNQLRSFPLPPQHASHTYNNKLNNSKNKEFQIEDHEQYLI